MGKKQGIYWSLHMSLNVYSINRVKLVQALLIIETKSNKI